MGQGELVHCQHLMCLMCQHDHTPTTTASSCLKLDTQGSYGNALINTQHLSFNLAHTHGLFPLPFTFILFLSLFFLRTFYLFALPFLSLSLSLFYPTFLLSGFSTLLMNVSPFCCQFHFKNAISIFFTSHKFFS